MILNGAFSSLGICGRHIFNDCQGLILVFNQEGLLLFIGSKIMAFMSTDNTFYTDCFLAR